MPRLTAYLILIAAAFVLPVGAQTAPDTAVKPAPAHSMEAVKVVARRSRGYAVPEAASVTRLDLPLRDTPRSVSVVTRQLIADQSMQTMADVVRYVPGVSMASGEGHRDAPTIRGQNTTADFFVDGARDDAQYFRDLYNVDRVEVLKGSEALLFGRGGGGGLINRVTRQANWTAVGSATLETGSYDHARATIDVGQPIDRHAAARMTGLYESSGGFRDAASLTRFGVNPTFALMAGERTLIRAGYELFDDHRRVDRGIPSFRGAPLRSNLATFFGNPSVNVADARVNIGSASVEHRASDRVVVRNRTVWSDYDKFYQNTFPGAVDATGTRVALSAYNHRIARRNLANISDATLGFATGRAKHTLLVGVDLTRQHTGQFRQTGYYNDSVASLTVPTDRPTVSTPVVFRQSATDADNTTLVTDASAYVQDHVVLSRMIQLIGGVRVERFRVDYDNNRSDQALSRADKLVSPRAGVVIKPVESLSLYASYGMSYLPSSGDQFTALTVTTAALEPERFRNREVGAKWDVGGAQLTGALYRLDRTNTTAPDPNNSALVVQTGAQRTIGWEMQATGSVAPRWDFSAGVAGQDARIVSQTSAAKSGATVPLVPRTTLSLWNRYRITDRIGAGAGVIRQHRMYAAIDNTVTLPGFTRFDAAVFATLSRNVQGQLNIENLLDRRYFATTQGNNNIMPGAPRTIRVSARLTR